MLFPSYPSPPPRHYRRPSRGDQPRPRDVAVDHYWILPSWNPTIPHRRLLTSEPPSEETSIAIGDYINIVPQGPPIPFGNPQGRESRGIVTDIGVTSSFWTVSFVVVTEFSGVVGLRVPIHHALLDRTEYDLHVAHIVTPGSRHDADPYDMAREWIIGSKERARQGRQTM
ncbi:hypothetical protein FPV67DRAFT_1452722 [Lyophyllum atratum]|nr:hypothetical protein FPV67DRAFT_1452722 [Lyophyllum atratum]